MANDVQREANFIRIRMELSTAFTPGGPVKVLDLLKGRIDAINRCIASVGQAGQHAILYGERGVGKTSIAGLVHEIWGDIAKDQDMLLPVRYNCESNDSFQAVWKNIAELIKDELDKRHLSHPTGDSWMELNAAIEDEEATPHAIRRLLDLLGRKSIIVIDEFNEISDSESIQAFSSMIKGLSDHLVDATIILVGVADSVDELIADHASIDRNLAQVLVPRMPTSELRQIIRAGYDKVGLNADETTIDLMGRLAQGLPHYAHRFGQEAGWAAVARLSHGVERIDVDQALRQAVTLTLESIRQAYHEATFSTQKATLFAKVLLACALAEVDDLDYFTAGNVRDPLALVAGKRYEIPQFVGHLKKFGRAEKGLVLEVTGVEWKRRYRFSNPLMRPYVVLRCIQEGLITEQQVKRFEINGTNKESLDQGRLF